MHLFPYLTPLLSDLTSFLSAAFGHWKGWLSGGGTGGAVVIAISLLERLVGKGLSKKAHFLIFVFVFFLCSCFLAWVDEHHKVLTLQNAQVKVPDLKFQMDSIWYGRRDRQCVVFVTGVLLNPVGSPTSVVNWKMDLEFGQRTVSGIAPMLPGRDLRMDLSKGKVWVLKKTGYLPDVTLSPIATGGAAAGWFWSIFPNVTTSDVDEYEPTVVLSFVDASTGTHHSFGRKMERHIRRLTVPGW